MKNTKANSFGDRIGQKVIWQCLIGYKFENDSKTIEKSQKLFHFGNSISSFGSDSVMPKVRLA